MAAGLTDYVWTMEELLSFRVPPDSLWYSPGSAFTRYRDTTLSPIPPFFVHCLGQQQRVRRPGQEAMSAVYCPARRPLGVVASAPGCHAVRHQEPHDARALHAGWLCDHAHRTPGLALCGDGPRTALYQ